MNGCLDRNCCSIDVLIVSLFDPLTQQASALLGLDVICYLDISIRDTISSLNFIWRAFHVGNARAKTTILVFPRDWSPVLFEENELQATSSRDQGS